MTTTIENPVKSGAAVGTVAAVVALFWTAFGAQEMRELLITSSVVVIASLAIFGLVVPRVLRRESAGGPAIAMGTPALLLILPAFWSGLPLILGAGAALTGNAGRTRIRGAKLSMTAMAIGILVSLGYVAIYVSEALAGNGGFLFD